MVRPKAKEQAGQEVLETLKENKNGASTENLEKEKVPKNKRKHSSNANSKDEAFSPKRLRERLPRGAKIETVLNGKNEKESHSSKKKPDKSQKKDTETPLNPEGKRKADTVETKKEEPVKRLRGQPKKEPAVDNEEINIKKEKPHSKAKKETLVENEEIIKKEKPQRKGKKETVVDDEEIIEEEKPQSKAKKDTKSASTKGKKKDKSTPKEKIGVERSVVKKGSAAAVDGLCPISSTAHVYCDEDIWDCTLNQTNIQFNNNKYYIIQLLKDDNKEKYSVWMRWGRVGAPGQNSLKPFAGNLENAKEAFTKKFTDKTRNEWYERDSFTKVFGKYDLLKMDYSDSKDEVDSEIKIKTEDDKPVKKVECKLEAKVKALIELICDVKAMEDAVIEMKYDAKKAPLGKLTSDQVKAGYAALKKIESIILGSSSPSNRDLLEACNSFYTKIPHYFGMKVPPLIRTKSEIQEKLALLQALGDIQAAMNIINQPLERDTHPVDQQYNGLECNIEAMDKEHAQFKLLEKYLQSTHGSTHSMYKIEVQDIFQVSKSSEGERFKDVGNRMLLWHGSRLTNWAGILSQGLRIAPPEAPCTGYMFGKGIYFADMSSKSANYCMPSYQNSVGLLVLCDVALGKSKELLHAEYEAHKLPKGFQSVKGVGKTAPDPKNFEMMDNVAIPMGPGINVGSKSKQNYSLQYNEYIVYDVSQVQIKYLVKVKFAFK